MAHQIQKHVLYSYNPHKNTKPNYPPPLITRNPHYQQYPALQNYWHNINQLHIQFPTLYTNFVPTSNILNSTDPKTITHVKQLNRLRTAPLT